MSVWSIGEIIDMGKSKYLERNLSQCHSVDQYCSHVIPYVTLYNNAFDPEFWKYVENIFWIKQTLV
jgi:hypothetical protein